jgi:hypothetical protein
MYIQYILQQINQSGDEMDRDQSTSRPVQVTAVYYMRRRRKREEK